MSDCVFVVRAAGRSAISAEQADSVKWIRSPDFDLHYVLRGRGALVIDGTRFALSRGEVCLVFPGESFLVLAEGALFERIYVHFDAVRLTPLSSWRGEPGRLFPRRTMQAASSRAFALCLQLVREFHSGEPGARAMASGYLTELLTGLLRAGARGRARLPAGVRKHLVRLDRARQLVEGQCGKKLRLAQLVAASGLSTNHFSKLFRQYTGQTPCRYLVRCRIERAKELLIENELSVSQIAYALAFEDVHYFSRAFKRIAGLSPLAYLRRVQANENMEPAPGPAGQPGRLRGRPFARVKADTTK